jgi:hypothetical protein
LASEDVPLVVTQYAYDQMGNINPVDHICLSFISKWLKWFQEI